MKKVILLLTATLFMSMTGWGQVSQSEANEITNRYIPSFNLPSNYLLYSLGLKKPNTVINTISIQEFVTTPSYDSYVYFVDDNPFANGNKDYKYIFVNASSGAISYTTLQYSPKDLHLATVLHDLELPPQGQLFDFSNVTPTNSNGRSPNNNYAVIISGGASPASNWVRYWNDCQAMYNVLKQKYGYLPSHIYVLVADGTDPANDRRHYNGTYDSSPLDFDGDGVNDIAYPATKSAITARGFTQVSRLRETQVRGQSRRAVLDV